MLHYAVKDMIRRVFHANARFRRGLIAILYLVTMAVFVLRIVVWWTRPEPVPHFNAAPGGGFSATAAHTPAPDFDEVSRVVYGNPGRTGK